MITVSRASQHHMDGLGVLQRVHEERLPPGGAAECAPSEDAEIITYVLEGALASLTTGAAAEQTLLQAGEFSRTSVASGVVRTATNPSPSTWAHALQIWLGARAAGLTPRHEQKRFCAAERRGVLRLIASPDGARGSLRIDQDARVFAALLAPGQHVIHELGRGRRAWVHVIRGEAQCAHALLAAGDGASVTGECGVSLTARGATDLVLVELP